MNKLLLSPLLLAIALQGCGSDSSDGSDTPKDPVEYTFSLNAQLTNDCGVSSAFTEVELLLQDDTWQTLQTYTPDENGMISFVTNNEYINYTVIAKDQKGSDAQGLNVVSYYQASSATPAYYQAQFDENLDNSTCECVTQNLKLFHRPFELQTSVTSSLAYDNWQAVDEDTTLFEGVNVCKTLAGEWPLHSFSVTGLDKNDKQIASADFISDFTATDSGIWQLSAFQVPDEIELNLPHQGFTTNQLIGNTKHFSSDIAEDVEQILVFDTHNYISETFYQSQASFTFTESSSIFGSAVIKTYHQVVSTESQVSFNVEANEKKPSIDDTYFSEIEADGGYDYSAVSGFPASVIVFNFTTYDPDSNLLMPAKWTFYGPNEGTLAISAPLTGYENIIGLDTDKKSTDIWLVKSASATNYQDYIKYYQAGNTVNGSINGSDDFVSNVEKIEVSISLN